MPQMIIVALRPPADLAARLALPGGLAAEDLHVTLAALGTLEELGTERLARVRAALAAMSAWVGPVAATLNGVGRFATDDPAGDAVYLAVDAPALTALHAEVACALRMADAPARQTHGFAPHITVAYVAPTAPTPLTRLEPTPVTFGALDLWAGAAREAFPLLGFGPPTYAQAALAHGEAVALSELPLEASEGVWNVLAYESELQGYRLPNGDPVRLTRADFEQCVANFTAYPKAPVVVEHADTREPDEVYQDWAEPRGWILGLRVGTFARPSGAVVASLEGRLLVDATTRLAINGDRSNGVLPKWPFGSVTVGRKRDPESGRDLGLALWSFSLTTHPRLADVPRLVASLSPTDVPATPDRRGPGAAPAPPTPEKTMAVLLTLAAALAIPAKDEAEAEAKITTLATEARDVRVVLGSATPAETTAKLSALTAAAAKLPALEAELKTFRDERTTREATARQAYVDDVLAGEFPGQAPETLKGVRASYELHARTDFEGFKAAHPRPSREELAQRAQDGARLERVVGKARTAPRGGDDAGPSANDLIAGATALVAAAAERGEVLSFADALGQLTEGGAQHGGADPEPADHAPGAEPPDDAP